MIRLDAEFRGKIFWSGINRLLPSWIITNCFESFLLFMVINSIYYGFFPTCIGFMRTIAIFLANVRRFSEGHIYESHQKLINFPFRVASLCIWSGRVIVSSFSLILILSATTEIICCSASKSGRPLWLQYLVIGPISTLMRFCSFSVNSKFNFCLV